MVQLIPYAEYARQQRTARAWVPNDVAEWVLVKRQSAVRAWREHFNLTQAGLAERMKVSQSALARFESPGARLRRATTEKIAHALGVTPEQLDID
jgi:predicted transcriptional regulator